MLSSRTHESPGRNVVKDPDSRKAYRADIDGLRAIAVLAVVFYHAAPGFFPGGFAGVDIFFVISGYLITSIIVREIFESKFTYRDFYARRARRLLPSLLVVLFATTVAGWPLLFIDEFNQLTKHVAAGIGFASNLIVWGEVGYFDNAAESKPLLHLWSLGVEEQFYLIWPIVIGVAFRLRWRMTYVTSVLFAGSFFYSLHASAGGSGAAYFSPLSRFWELAVGSMLAVGLSSPWSCNANRDRRPASRVMTEVLAFGGLVMTVGSIWVIDKSTTFPAPWALMPVGGAALLIGVGMRSRLAEYALSSRPMVSCGKISYSMYLWHWPLLSYCHIMADGAPSRVVRVSAVVLSIILAWVTTRLVERPIRFAPANRGGVVRWMCALAVIMFVMNVAAFSVGGERYGKNDRPLIARVGQEHIPGSSISWYAGRDGWLFLGNRSQKCVAKLKGAIVPNGEDIQRDRTLLAGVSNACHAAGAKFLLVIGPNKSSIYPEYLPDAVRAGPQRYVDLVFRSIGPIDGMVVYDPQQDLLMAKSHRRLLYWRTDTHWNLAGSYAAARGVARALDVPIPDVEFRAGPLYKGDLVLKYKLWDAPVMTGDNWMPYIGGAPLGIAEVERDPVYSQGIMGVARSKDATSGSHAWVWGDSCLTGLRPYFEIMFQKVTYKGHWRGARAEEITQFDAGEGKPDVVIMVRVERSF
jgi:peptidoglycan/LPS O-acetylase OafA/YrhL